MKPAAVFVVCVMTNQVFANHDFTAVHFEVRDAEGHSHGRFDSRLKAEIAAERMNDR